MSEKKRVYEFQENGHKFQRIGYSDIISFVYEGKEVQKYMQYEVCMTVCMGRIANQRKIAKWLPFKNYKSETFDVHMWGIYVHMCTKYKVSMSNPVGEVRTDDTNADAG